MVNVVNGKTIFESSAQTLVNTINCVGVMGKGIALEFKNRYPAMFDKYKSFCNKGVFKPGVLWIYKAEDGKWVLNFPTKIDWRNPSKMEYIEEGLKKFVEIWEEKGIKSIAFPLLGCSNGGLNADEVISLMKKYLNMCDGLDVTIYDDREEVDEKKVSEVVTVIEESSNNLKDENETPAKIVENAPELDPNKVDETKEEGNGYKNEDNEEVKIEKITVNTETIPVLHKEDTGQSEEELLLKHLVKEKKEMQKEIDEALNDFVGKENNPETRKEVTRKIVNVINRRGFPMGSVFQI